MKRNSTIHNRLNKRIQLMRLEITKLLLEIDDDLIDTLKVQLESYLTIIKSEINEYDNEYQSLINSGEYKLTNLKSKQKMINRYLNNLFDYHYEFYNNDYVESKVFIDRILNDKEERYYLLSNLYTLVCAYFRLLLLYKIIINILDENDNVFSITQYKQLINNELKTL